MIPERIKPYIEQDGNGRWYAKTDYAISLDASFFTSFKIDEDNSEEFTFEDNDGFERPINAHAMNRIAVYKVELVSA